MAATKYTYSIADDTANGIVNSDSLSEEISNSNIVTALDYVESSEDVLDVWFKDSLSTGDETILDSLVDAHTGASTEPDPIIVTPTAPKNEYGLRPYGLVHKHIDASSYIYDITLSNKDELEIDYSCSETPEFYDCIFQEDSEVRDGVYSVSGNTITTFNGILSNGSAKLSKPIDLDYKIVTREQVALVYLWGMYFSAEDFGEDDIGRLQVCDPDGVGVTAGLYTQEQLEAMNYIVKEYDECWISQVDNVIKLDSVNNTPAEVLNGFVLRVKYYPKDATKTNIKVWLDYRISIKDED